MPAAVLDRPLLSVRSVAAKLAVSDKTVWRLIRAGKLPAVRVGGQLRVDPVELTCWLYHLEPPDGYEVPGSTGAAREGKA